jgi:hypothetical protein
MQVVHQAALLRGQGRFQEAITLIESNLDQLDNTELVPTLLQAFHAATQMNAHGKARLFAMAIASEDPGITTIESYLRQYK